MTETVDLATTPFPLLLAYHFHRHSTGTLALSAGLHKKRIYFKDGSAVFAGSNDRNDRLGEMLLRRGLLGLPDFLSSSADMVPGKRFGTLLVERGLLSPNQLVWAVKEQVMEIIFSLFPLAAGTSQLEEGPAGDGEIITLNINTPELIRRGVARMDNATWALETFTDRTTQLRLTQPAKQVLEHFSLDPKDVHVVMALQAGGSLEDLCSGTLLHHFDLLKLLWALKILGFLAAGGPVPVTPERPPAAQAVEPEDFDVTGDDLKDLI